MRKIRLEDIKEFKIERKVFDRKTLLVIYKLMSKGVINTVESIIREGKESCVFSGKDKNNNWVAIKVYRTEACDFKNMWKYLVGDPRFHRIGKRRRVVINSWCKREFKNLKIAKEARVDCPKPLFFKENILIMSFIGKNGIAAPRLIDIIPKNPKRIYRIILENLRRLVKAGLVHGDLSAYNILFFKNPYLIDFSHGTTIKNQIALNLLKRDIKNINSYFSKLNVPVKDSENVYRSLLKLVE